MLTLGTVFLAFAATPSYQEQDSWRTWLADLRPSYIREEGGRPRSAAVQPLLEFLLLQGGPEASAEDRERESTTIFERLAPQLQAEHCAWILQQLEQGTLKSPETARALLLSARVSESSAALRAVALDDQRDLIFRGEAVRRFLDAEGRAGLESIRELLQPETEALLLRRIYTSWAAMIEPADLPVLEELAREGPSLCRELALQTWARVETRDDKRVEILRLSEGSDSAYRSVLVRELALPGPSAAVAEYLQGLLSVPRSEDRRLGLSMLAVFAEPQTVLDEWLGRRQENDPLSIESMWMVQLCRLPLTQARQIAAEWLVDRGWKDPRMGPAVARTLAQFDELDPLLGGFLRREDVPFPLRVQIAADRAKHNGEAAQWVREHVPEAQSILGLRLMRALGELGAEQDLRQLMEFARDPGRPGLLRAEAVRALAKVPGGKESLSALVKQPPADYETAEALVETAVLAGDPELRAATLRAVESGFPAGAAGRDPEEIAALRRTAWRAQQRDPRAQEAESLSQQASAELAAIPLEDPSTAWLNPRELRGEHTQLVEVVLALAATVPAHRQDLLRPSAQATEGSFVGRAIWAEAALEKAPRVSSNLAAALASDPRLARGNRLRSLGLAARAARKGGNSLAEGAILDRIFRLLSADLNEGDLADLGYGMGLPSPRGWLLPLDEIGQRMLLAQARDLPQGRGTALGGLLEAGCPTDVLLEACDLLAEAESWSACLRFARRASDFEPHNVRARWHQGRALEALDRADDAAAAYREAVRHGPNDPRYARFASSRLSALQPSDR